MRAILSILVAVLFAAQTALAGYNIILGTGQSNMTGYSTNYPDCAGDPDIVYGNDYTSHPISTYTNWDSSSGQVDTVSSDGSGAKSSWIRALSLLLRAAYPNDTNIFVPCSLGGTYIADWAPGVDPFDRTTLFGSADYRAAFVATNFVPLTLGGTVTRKINIFELGESDSSAQTASATFATGYTNFTTQLYQNSGYATLAVIIQQGNYNHTGWTQVTNAINNSFSVGTAHISGLIDISSLTSDGPDLIHFSSLNQLFTVATNALLTFETQYPPPAPPPPVYFPAHR